MKRLKEILNEEIIKFNKFDYIILFILVGLYTILSFYRLGDNFAPNTFLRINKDRTIDVYLKNEATSMKIYYGEKRAHYKLYIGKTTKELSLVDEIDKNREFSWDEYIFSEAKIVRLIFQEDASIGEIHFNESEIDHIEGYKETYLLFDEANTVPDKISYMNSSYFDEIYFATTAYQYVYGMDTYEWTHPPLGKLIQAIPIYLTHNMSPFNYRLMGNISGILILIVMYYFGAFLFHKRKYAITSLLLMGLDTFHFAHTRMGTVDSHLILMMLLSILFMLKYIKEDNTKLLYLSGLFFGLSICIKWTAFYGGLALAILYLGDAIINKKINNKVIRNGVLFFCLIPFGIYLALYFIFPNNLYKTNNFKMFWKEQIVMYEYHSKLKADHFFSSKWYQWPISYKPVWYHQRSLTDNTKETISGVGNLVIWIGGFIGFIYLIPKYILFKDKKALQLIVIICALWLPFILIDRIMFQYHYFPILPFIMFSVIELIKDMEETYHFKNILISYLALSLLFFIIYYPVVSGIEISNKYADSIKLFYTWYF